MAKTKGMVLSKETLSSRTYLITEHIIIHGDIQTLNWIGKEKVVNHHLETPFDTLEHRYGFGEENNLKVQKVPAGI